MQKNYYFIYYYAQKKVSPLELKKGGVPAIEASTVIDKHPFEWMVDNKDKFAVLLKHYQRISREEYDYFQNNINHIVPETPDEETK